MKETRVHTGPSVQGHLVGSEPRLCLDRVHRRCLEHAEEEQGAGGRRAQRGEDPGGGGLDTLIFFFCWLKLSMMTQ